MFASTMMIASLIYATQDSASVHSHPRVSTRHLLAPIQKGSIVSSNDEVQTTPSSANRELKIGQKDQLRMSFEGEIGLAALKIPVCLSDAIIHLE
jgi:hypothetical protein